MHEFEKLILIWHQASYLGSPAGACYHLGASEDLRDNQVRIELFRWWSDYKRRARPMHEIGLVCRRV